MKKVVSIILIVILTLGMLPVRAGAILPDEPPVYRYSKSETVDSFVVDNGEVLVIPKGVCITVTGKDSWIGYGQIVIEKGGRLIFKTGDHIIRSCCSIICEGRLDIWENASLTVANNGSLLILENGMFGVKGKFGEEEGSFAACFGKYKGEDKSVLAEVAGAQVFLRDYGDEDEDDGYTDVELTEYSAKDAITMLPKNIETFNSQRYSDGINSEMPRIFLEDEWHVRWSLSNGKTLEMAVSGDPERRRIVYISGVKMLLEKAPLHEATADKNLLYKDGDVRVKLTKLGVDDFDEIDWAELTEEELFKMSDVIAKVTVKELKEADIFFTYNDRERTDHRTFAEVSIDKLYKGTPKEEKETYTVSFDAPMCDMVSSYLSFPELTVGGSYILFLTDPENYEYNIQMLDRYTDFGVEHPTCSIAVDGKYCHCDDFFSDWSKEASEDGHGKYIMPLKDFEKSLKKAVKPLG